MPGYSGAARRAEATASFQFRDWRGKPYSATGVRNAAGTSADVTAAAGALGALSNARLMEQRVTDASVQINPADPLNTAFDEAYASTDDQLAIVFQNSVGDIQEWRIPAPDALLFFTDGETPLIPDGAAAAGTGPKLLADAIAALLTLMGGTYVFSRMYKSGVRRRARTPLPLAEPSGNPGAGPGE